MTAHLAFVSSPPAALHLPRYCRLVEKLDASGNTPLVVFESSEALEHIARPGERLTSMLGDDALAELQKRFHLDEVQQQNLRDHVERARRVARHHRS